MLIRYASSGLPRPSLVVDSMRCLMARRCAAAHFAAAASQPKLVRRADECGKNDGDVCGVAEVVAVADIDIGLQQSLRSHTRTGRRVSALCAPFGRRSSSSSVGHRWRCSKKIWCWQRWLACGPTRLASVASSGSGGGKCRLTLPILSWERRRVKKAAALVGYVCMDRRGAAGTSKREARKKKDVSCVINTPQCRMYARTLLSSLGGWSRCRGGNESRI